MQFTREAVEAKHSTLIQVALAAAAVENPYRLYYGESDMPTPEFIRHALTEAVNAGHTTYTTTPGVIELRNAICRKFLETQCVRISYASSESVLVPSLDRFAEFMARR